MRNSCGVHCSTRFARGRDERYSRKKEEIPQVLSHGVHLARGAFSRLLDDGIREREGEIRRSSTGGQRAVFIAVAQWTETRGRKRGVRSGKGAFYVPERKREGGGWLSWTRMEGEGRLLGGHAPGGS